MATRRKPTKAGSKRATRSGSAAVSKPAAKRRTKAATLNPLDRLRDICLALPEAHEVEAWGEPTFRVCNKLFAMHAHANNHHGAGRNAVWCKAKPGKQA